MISDYDILQDWIQKAQSTADSQEKRTVLNQYYPALMSFIKARRILLDSVYFAGSEWEELKQELKINLHDIETRLWLAECVLDTENILDRVDSLASSVGAQLEHERTLRQTLVTNWEHLLSDAYELLITQHSTRAGAA